MQELRTEPRQRRSQQSIDAILDAAERLIAQQGQVGFTANELASEAGMSIGRVYYWFPDIPAVITALVERGAIRMTDALTAAVTMHSDEATSMVLQHAIRTLCVYVENNPAAVSLCISGGEGGAGRLMHERLLDFAAALVKHRVPGIPDIETMIVARTMVGITLGMLNGYHATTPELRPHIEQELVYVLASYVFSRFPPSDDVAWTLSDRSVQPSRPSRRLNARVGQVWPAFAPDQPS
jgi:AcrR family transcriptional regulator